VLAAGRFRVTKRKRTKPPLGTLLKESAGDQFGVHNRVICDEPAEAGASLGAPMDYLEAISACGKYVVESVPRNSS
jgi:hypothetical protein